ncbi:AAA-type ATPase family protein [Klebsormidium nitens]|uniref:microtubule-severing ATPase n=1 Tax=Klebsormidium nitens TaxID=105231 RepID=A0A1Y1IDP1_KLENI|nr:AAA-type ATPase family protein [Klebsormidium nitens]|eukprot:GAQ86208.1 AAA-type ATPase family protein [Klebsormidium nitens]
MGLLAFARELVRFFYAYVSLPSQAPMLGWMRKGSPSEGPGLKAQFAKLQGFHDLARDVIRRGVECDSKKQANNAASFYLRGLEVLQEGLNLPIAANINGSDEVQRLVDAMQRWKVQVTERLESVTGAKPSGASSDRPSPASYADWLASGTEKKKKPATTPRSTSGPASVQRTTSANGRAAAPPQRRVMSSGGSVSATGGQSRAEVKGVPQDLVRRIEEEIVDSTGSVKWDDIAGLQQAKNTLTEMVLLPTLRGDLFKGLRAPPRGLLLFGPPGNGKTMLAKAVAAEAKATFFSISAASLTSKWVGEGEKLVRALFAVAKQRQPAMIFIDEIDSILSARSASEHDASRRLKTEFLVQFDGVMSSDEDRIIVMGATNRPEELDEAVRRRLVKRIYIPLPDAPARRALLDHVLRGQAVRMSERDLARLVAETDTYSGSDLHALCREAAMEPIRELGSRITTVELDQVRPLVYSDFTKALRVIRPSVSRDQLQRYEKWNRDFGSL